MKQFIMAVVAIFVAWSIMDFILHGLLLSSTYEASSELWRPMDDMKMGLMYGVTLVVAIAFVCLYRMTTGGGVGTGLRFGLLLGIATGFSMGFGTYSVQPLPLSLAWAWFLGTTVEAAVGGVLAGAILTEDA